MGGALGMSGLQSAESFREAADARHSAGDLTGAIDAYEQAVALDESNLPAWWGLGCATLARGDHAAAAASFARVVAIAPGHGQARHNLGKALFHLGQIDAALEAFREAASVLQPPDQTLATIATIIPGSPSADNRAVIDARRSWARVGAPGSRAAKTFPDRALSPDRRIRIGYLSSFFEYPNWMKPVWGLINHHDRDQFEVHLFSDAPRADVELGYTGHVDDRFHDITRLSNAKAARLIETQAIDVLVDLNGYSRIGRLPVPALRPAPVQVAWFNMFAASGLDCFDYLIGDEHVVPEEDEVFYTECIARVPGCYLTFEVTYPVPDVVPAPCLSRGTLTFGCLSPQYKITPQVVEAWSRILRACSDCHLFLKNGVLDSASNRRFVQEQFARFGVAADRLALEGRADHLTFLGSYTQVDVALDPFPYNGGTTTMEALWQGVPVLTFAGDRWASRISASLMRNAGLPEFVQGNLDGYVAAAVELASGADTPARLDRLRRSMRERLRAAPVCDVRGFARDMERAYARMWHRHCAQLR
jgi:protein O-GlcNAc transferase